MQIRWRPNLEPDWSTVASASVTHQRLRHANLQYSQPWPHIQATGTLTITQFELAVVSNDWVYLHWNYKEEEQVRQQDTNPPYGGTHPGGGLLVKLITLRLTVFERFAVKWPKFSPKISDLGIQSSSAFDKTGIIAIPLKSSHVMVLVRQSFGFGIGTM